MASLNDSHILAKSLKEKIEKLNKLSIIIERRLSEFKKEFDIPCKRKKIRSAKKK